MGQIRFLIFPQYSEEHDKGGSDLDVVVSFEGSLEVPSRIDPRENFQRANTATIGVDDRGSGSLE